MKMLDGYGAPKIPILGYAALIATYSLTFGTLLAMAGRGGRPLRQPRGFDFALLMVASYKLSRVVTMSYIASPLRAPFCKRGESLSAGEVQDVARGTGLQNAIGHMITCPFCFSVWASTAFLFGYTLAPRATKQAAYILSMAAADDLLHLGFKNLRERSV